MSQGNCYFFIINRRFTSNFIKKAKLKTSVGSSIAEIACSIHDFLIIDQLTSKCSVHEDANMKKIFVRGVDKCHDSFLDQQGKS